MLRVTTKGEDQPVQSDQFLFNDLDIEGVRSINFLLSDVDIKVEVSFIFL